MKTDKINWGIIGCGDVTELKSGPAFNKVPNSSLVAVMRRDGDKAKDYANRHQVPKWYSNAEELIYDDEVNAIYIATPPAFHEAYTLAAFNAGKPVYVEKPMALNYEEADSMVKAAKERQLKLSVAHYRREQPLFKKVKQLLDEHAIGEVRCVHLDFYKKPLNPEALNVSKVAWRVDPALAGGGLFHDLAPHQLDLMHYFFGPVKSASGLSTNQGKLYNADDIVAGNMLFESGVIFNGLWCFNVAAEEQKDWCEIIGSEGKISFPIFEHQQIILTKQGNKEIIPYEPLQHVQQPMIQQVVSYFLGEGYNPGTPEDGREVMKWMEDFTRK